RPAGAGSQGQGWIPPVTAGLVAGGSPAPKKPERQETSQLSSEQVAERAVERVEDRDGGGAVGVVASEDGAQQLLGWIADAVEGNDGELCVEGAHLLHADEPDRERLAGHVFEGVEGGGGGSA